MTKLSDDRKEKVEIIFKKPSLDDVQIALEKVQRLSPAQKTVLNYLILGFSNKEIAHELFVTPETVKVHCSDIFKKLDVNNRTQAALLGYLTKIQHHLQLQSLDAPSLLQKSPDAPKTNHAYRN